jgi:hypothetical protein
VSGRPKNTPVRFLVLCHHLLALLFHPLSVVAAARHPRIGARDFERLRSDLITPSSPIWRVGHESLDVVVHRLMSAPTLRQTFEGSRGLSLLTTNKRWLTMTQCGRSGTL